MNPPSGIEAIRNGQWVVEGDTHLGAWAKHKGTIVTDPNLFRWLRPFIEEAGVVWDIGANIGDHARQYIDWGKRVVAFEPHPVTYKCLVHNCPEAVCYNVAASNAAGSLRFASLDNVGASRVRPDGDWCVPGLALDDMPALPAPDFVKIDVEGFEPNVIIGMAGTITRYRPILFVEMNPGALEQQGFTVEGLREQIESLGYTAAALYPPKATWQDPQFDCLFIAK